MKVLLYQFHIKNFFPTEKYGAYWELSHESCRQYAETHGFDYKLDLYENKESWAPLFSFIQEPQWEQFRAIRYLKDYDAVLFVDSDVLIKSNSDNIIEKYKNEGSNIVVNTRIGNKLLNTDYELNTLQFNTGVVLWFNKSRNTDNFYDLKPKNYAYHGEHFLLSKFVEDRKNLRWWENWEDLQNFVGKYPTGRYHDEKFLTLIISLFDLPLGHLDCKYNYRFINEKLFNKHFEYAQFIHYPTDKKQYMKKHYNLIVT
jgi:hypothetical protein